MNGINLARTNLQTAIYSTLALKFDMSKGLSHCANAIAFHHAILELRGGGNESLACFIVLRVFVEVLDAALSPKFPD